MMEPTDESGGGAGADWAAYTEGAARIAALLRDEQTRTSERAAAAREVRARVERLARRLDAQRQHLAQLATILRLPTPHVDGVVPSPVPDPAQALREGSTAADASDHAAQEAHRRAARPPLLPGLTPLARNIIVYAVAAFLGTLLSIVMYLVSPAAEFGEIPFALVPWSLCGMPALAFFAGYLTIILAGRPRIGDAGTRSPQAGGLICFVGMPIMWFIFIASTMG